MKWIRWKGVVAFVLIVGALAVCFKLYAGTAVKKVVEAAGTKAVGARVDLSSASLSVIPLGMTLEGLQVTDPDEPMSNMVDISEIRFSMEPGRLLLGKVIIDEMRVDGIRLNTPRQVSGALPETPQKKDKKTAGETKDRSGDASFKLPSFNIPDVKDVLAKEPLAVVEKSQALKKDMEAFKDDIEKRIKNLPDKKDFNAYEDRIKDLKPKKLSLGSIMGQLDELKGVKKDIKKDLDAIESLKEDVKQGAKDYKKRIEALPSMAGAEIARLKAKYAPTPQGMGNVSALFFGPKTSAWVTRGLNLYQKVKPFLESEASDTPDEKTEEEEPEREKGVNVVFRESEPLPDVLVKHAALSVNLESGVLKGDLFGATDDQHITGKPMTFSFESKELSGIHDLAIDGRVDRVKSGNPVDSLKASVKGFSLDAMELAEKSPMGIRISQAKAHADMDLTLENKALGGSVTASLSPVTLSPAGEGGDERLKRALGKSLADVKSLNVKGVISGRVSDVRLDLSSDLDKVLKQVVNDMVKSLADEFSKELEARVREKVQEQVASLTGDLDGLSGYDKELEKRLKLGKNALKGL